MIDTVFVHVKSSKKIFSKFMGKYITPNNKWDTIILAIKVSRIVVVYLFD